MAARLNLPFAPSAVRTFELATTDLWDALKGVSVRDLETLTTVTRAQRAVRDALIDVRIMMDGGVPARRLLPREDHDVRRL